MKNLPTYISVLIALALMSFSYVNPIYDWDALAYSAILLKWQGLAWPEVHSFVYNDLLSSLPRSTQEFLNTNEFEIRSRNSQPYFTDQIPFYTIKPLYLGLAYATMSFGFNPLQSLQVVSALGLGLMFIITFKLLSNVCNAWWSLIVSLAICAHPIVLLTGRLLTPDMISSALILVAVYLFLQKKEHPAMIILLLSIGFRPDNVLIALFAPFLLLQSRRFSTSLLYGAGAVFIFLSIQFLFKGWGWKITFQHSIISLQTSVPEWRNIPLTLKEYVRWLIVYAQRYQLLLAGGLIIGILGFAAALKNSNVLFFRVAFILTVTTFIRWLSFPRFDVRYNVVAFVFALILITIAVLTRQRKAIS